MSLTFSYPSFFSPESEIGAIYLAHGDAADVWKVPSSAIRPERVTKVLRINPKRLIGTQLTDTTHSHNRKNSWNSFVEEYALKVERWSALDHPNILQVFGYGSGLNLEIAYCENGCVRDFLRSDQGGIDKRTIICDVLNGLAYLHGRNPSLVHGNLNTGKLFVSREGKTMIGEFGLSALCSPFSAYMPMISFAGLVRWLSPEMFSTEDAVSPTTAADIWAMGCIMLEVCTGALPYSKYKHDIKIRREILAERLPGEYDSTLDAPFLSTIWPLMKACWEFLPNNRPTASSLSETFDARCTGQGPMPHVVSATASSSSVLLTEEEVLNAFDHFICRSVEHAKTRDLLANSWDGGELDVLVSGPALCLYYAAMRSDTTLPSVAMPRYEGSSALQKRLDSSTCPVGFRHLFERWAQMVPEILDLPRNNQFDLERLLCNPPLDVPAEYHTVCVDNPTTPLMHGIGNALSLLAFEISRCRKRQPVPRSDYPRSSSSPITFSTTQLFGTSKATPAVNLSGNYNMSPNNPLLGTDYVKASAENNTIAPILAHTSMVEIINLLCGLGCRNLSEQLNQSICSKYPISRGSYRQVFYGNLFDGTEVAIKTMITDGHVTDEVQNQLKYAARELHVLSKRRHSNIEQMLGLTVFREQIAMVSLWVELGDLPTYVNFYPDVDQIDLCIQLAAGLAHLHLIGIVHGDLKGANVLVSGEGVATLINFGSAACEESRLHFAKMTPSISDTSFRWAAPEILEGGTVSAEADVYALGMTALEALTGSAPYNGLRDTAAITAILVKKGFPVRPNNDILGMTERDRPTAEQVRISFEKIKELG